jgi:hypothetical protein
MVCETSPAAISHQVSGSDLHQCLLGNTIDINIVRYVLPVSEAVKLKFLMATQFCMAQAAV